MSETVGAAAGPRSVAVHGEALVFGFPTRPVELTVRYRPLAWRAGGAARTFAIFLVIAPFAGLVPPHAPWAIGALAVGAILARRRWIERVTLERAEGSCPKCDAPLAVKAGRLRRPHPVACESCHHQIALRFPEEVMGER
jgi:hypothetical protein